jgi:hypothetical protein
MEQHSWNGSKEWKIKSRDNHLNHLTITSLLLTLLVTSSCGQECQVQFNNGICVNNFDPSLTNDPNYLTKLELATDYLILSAEWKYNLDLQDIINDRGMTINLYSDNRDYAGRITILRSGLIMELNQQPLVGATVIAHEFMHIYFWFVYNQGDFFHSRPEWSKSKISLFRDLSFEASLASTTSMVIGEGWLFGECMNSNDTWDTQCLLNLEYVKMTMGEG